MGSEMCIRDRGYTDPFVCLLGLLDDAGCLWVTWERYQTQMDILEHARALTQVNEAIKRKYGGYGVEQFAADASQPGSIELLKDHGLDVIKAPNSAGSIETGIELVRATMRSGKLKIYQPTEGEGTCPGLIKELRMYAYAVENDKPYGNKPVDKHSHAPDALRYLVWLVNRYADFLSLAA